MSAYGEIKRAYNAASLPATKWKGPATGSTGHGACITVHHLTLGSARSLPGLIQYLSAVFEKEVEDGLTYPQEGDMPQSTFEAYFFAADVFVGLVGEDLSVDVMRTATEHAGDHDSAAADIETQRAGRRSSVCRMETRSNLVQSGSAHLKFCSILS